MSAVLSSLRPFRNKSRRRGFRRSAVCYGGRTPNDLLITAQYNSGGSLATAIVYQWKLVSGTYQWVDITSSIAVEHRIRGNQHSGWGIGALRRIRRDDLLEEPICRDVDRCDPTN